MAAQEEEKARQEQERAMAAAQAAPRLVVEGQEEGEVQYARMGRYELVEGKVVGGRAVWEQRKGGGGGGAGAAYLYYRSSKSNWNIGSKSEMEGASLGDLKWVDGGQALTPDDGEGHAAEAGAGAWEAWDGDEEEWVEVPGLRVRRA